MLTSKKVKDLDKFFPARFQLISNCTRTTVQGRRTLCAHTAHVITTRVRRADSTTERKRQTTAQSRASVIRDMIRYDTLFIPRYSVTKERATIQCNRVVDQKITNWTTCFISLKKQSTLVGRRPAGNQSLENSATNKRQMMETWWALGYRSGYSDLCGRVISREAEFLNC